MSVGTIILLSDVILAELDLIVDVVISVLATRCGTVIVLVNDTLSDCIESVFIIPAVTLSIEIGDNTLIIPVSGEDIFFTYNVPFIFSL